MSQQQARTIEDLAQEHDTVLLKSNPDVAKCAICGRDADVTLSVAGQGFMVHCPSYYRPKNHSNATACLPQLAGAIAVWNYMQADPWINTVKGFQ